jgi:hypothetical protein|eukprot:COSAG02_NODE_1563_length_11913_cov_6.216438_8_plen_40_part_00
MNAELLIDLYVTPGENNIIAPASPLQQSRAVCTTTLVIA